MVWTPPEELEWARARREDDRREMAESRRPASAEERREFLEEMRRIAGMGEERAEEVDRGRGS